MADDTEDDSDTPPTGKRNRSTAAVVLQRAEAVLRLRIGGAAFPALREYADAQKWDVSDTQLRRYISKADDMLRERTERSIAKLARMHDARREALYALALSAGDYRLALDVLRDQAKLDGFYDQVHKLEAELNALLARISTMEAERGIEPTPPKEKHAYFRDSACTSDFTAAEQSFTAAEEQAEDGDHPADA